MLDSSLPSTSWPILVLLASSFTSRTAVNISRVEKVQHKRCLELGAGLGLTGLTLCKLGTKQAVLTDYAEPVLRNLQNNLEISKIYSSFPVNSFVCLLLTSFAKDGMVVSPFASIPNGELEGEGQGAHVNVTALDWLIFSEDELKRFAPDVILAADVVGVTA